MNENTYVKFIKSFLDRFLGIMGLLILSVPMLFISAAIRLESEGPIVFRQRRVGKKKDGRLTYFTIYKFRTMYADAPKNVPTHLLENAEKYVTGVGHFLRKYSLDELPQLWNIAVSHDLSIVGPRPALWNQKDLVEERERYGANDVMPGLTGWAQVNGRDELEIIEKAYYDGQYVEKIQKGSLSAFIMDLRCFSKTIWQILRSEGVKDGKQSYE